MDEIDDDVKRPRVINEDGVGRISRVLWTGKRIVVGWPAAEFGA